MSLTVTGAGTFLTSKEAASELGVAYRTFANYRTSLGDGFLQGHELVPGRVFFKIQDVHRLAKERAR